MNWDQRTRSVAAAGVGTLAEYFDYASYSYLATTIAVVFFPAGDRTVALLQAFALFALSFAMRPVGALFWGRFGDRQGRKKALERTIIGMGFATFLIGLLPGYSTIGMWAPILLVILRLLQSFFTAGEYSGAAVLVGEFAPPARRGRYVSVVPIGCALGFLLASALASLLHGSLTEAQMSSWGWRVPFLIAGTITLAGWYVRRALEETPDFTAVVAAKSVTDSPVKSLLREHWRLVVRLLCVMGVNAGGYYLVLGYMATYLEVEGGLSASHASVITSIALLVYLPLLYLSAALSDRVGRRRVLMASSLLFILLSYPAFRALEGSGFVTMLLIQLLLVAVFALNDGSFASYFVEAFPPNVRFSGFSLPFNIGVALFGGTTPLLATWLIQQTGNKLMPAFIMMVVAAVGLLALMFRQTEGLSILRNGRHERDQAGLPDSP